MKNDGSQQNQNRFTFGLLTWGSVADQAVREAEEKSKREIEQLKSELEREKEKFKNEKEKIELQSKMAAMEAEKKARDESSKQITELLGQNQKFLEQTAGQQKQIQTLIDEIRQKTRQVDELMQKVRELEDAMGALDASFDQVTQASTTRSQVSVMTPLTKAEKGVVKMLTYAFTPARLKAVLFLRNQLVNVSNAQASEELNLLVSLLSFGVKTLAVDLEKANVKSDLKETVRQEITDASDDKSAAVSDEYKLRALYLLCLVHRGSEDGKYGSLEFLKGNAGLLDFILTSSAQYFDPSRAIELENIITAVENKNSEAEAEKKETKFREYVDYLGKFCEKYGLQSKIDSLRSQIKSSSSTLNGPSLFSIKEDNEGNTDKSGDEKVEKNTV